MKSDFSNLKERAFSGIIWKFLEKISVQVVQFAIQIVLARLLTPEDYGIIGLLTIFIAISEVFIQKGFAIALIQRKDTDEIDYSSVFWANIIMSLVIYAIWYIIAPYVAVFYNEQILTRIMRILCLNVIVGGFSAVHNAIMIKRLEFRKSFVRNIANVATQGVVGIGLAFAGFGVWALVLSKLAGTLIGSVVLYTTIRWHPKRIFSCMRIKSMFSYSSKLLGSNLIKTIFNNIHSLIIGKFFLKTELGFYQKGRQLPQVLMEAVDGSLNEVLYPTLSIIQDDLTALKNTLRRSMKTSMFVVLPLLFGFFVISEEVVLILLTEKWLSCVPYMQLSCILCAFWPLSARGHALNAIGKSNITFKLTLISNFMTLFFIVINIRFGIYAIMLGSICSSAIGVLITSHFVNKYIHYSFGELVKDLLPSILLSIVMMFLVMIVGIINMNIYVKIILQVFTGLVVYIGLAYLLKVESLSYILTTIENIKKTNNSNERQ